MRQCSERGGYPPPHPLAFLLKVTGWRSLFMNVHPKSGGPCFAMAGRAELEKEFAGLPVVFAGMMQGQQLAQAYASGDMFITPSESETLGNVVLEAMASGLPVVAARAGGIPDIVQDGETGLLFDPGSVDDAVSKVRQVLNSKSEKERLSHAARTETEKLDWKLCSAVVRNEAYSAAVQSFLEKKHKGSTGSTLVAAASPSK